MKWRRDVWSTSHVGYGMLWWHSVITSLNLVSMCMYGEITHIIWKTSINLIIISFHSNVVMQWKFASFVYRQRNTYWCTTGLYPQVFILTFPNPVIIYSIKIRSYLGELIVYRRKAGHWFCCRSFFILEVWRSLTMVCKMCKTVYLA